MTPQELAEYATVMRGCYIEALYLPDGSHITLNAAAFLPTVGGAAAPQSSPATPVSTPEPTDEQLLLWAVEGEGVPE